ncbi:CpaD family pilus assembly lipoprotein [Paraburkholderia sp. HP33-1]|uniref:CpaD family pilus assembly lipoprotein n=1 Tax=Paraburkholderia sp. HP33-1 TaxID=2883243 RepID=UPI001F274A5E|nr:CpaD family pilus assembly lipoprotein [Paraburkholderia sp. HP33-1]
MLLRLIGIGLVPLLLSGCMSATPPLGLPDTSMVGFDGRYAIAPDCATLVQPSHLIDAGHARPGIPFGCATLTNLAVMLARPEDLIAPLPYAGSDATSAAGAVRRFEEGRVKQPNATSTTTSSTH